MKAKLVYNKQEVLVNIPKTLELLSLSCNVIALLISDDMEYVSDDELEGSDEYIDGLLNYADDTLGECYEHIHAHYLKIAKKHFTIGEGIKIKYSFVNNGLTVNFTDDVTELVENEADKNEFMGKINDILKG